MTEFELIAQLIPSLPSNASVIVGAGDDCAVLDLGLAEHFLLFKTDAVVEGVHFTRATAPEKIGHKALARCFSDIAAMAGTPSHALVTIGLPQQFDVKVIEGIYKGLNHLAVQHGTAIVGGETTTNPERMFVSISVLGKVPKGRCIRRSGACAGDALFVTGELGGSLANKHLEFTPRLKEARWLAEHFSLHAMIDLSDGLAGDLPHLIKASGVGAELLSSAIPISRAARERSRRIFEPTRASDRQAPEPPVAADVRRRTEGGRTNPPPCVGGYASAVQRADVSGNSLPETATTPKPPLLAALTDGEDFELLFTVPSAEAVPLLDAWKKAFPELRLSCIGKIMAGSGILMRDRESVRPLAAHGYDHFA